MNDMKKTMHISLKTIFFLVLIWGVKSFSQCGSPSNTTGPGTPDPTGFVSLFNGEDFSGWWISCLTGHGRNFGGDWWVEDGTLYSNQGIDGEGGLFFTNRTYKNFEFQMDFWPSYGNDGGIFLRSTAQGNAYQIVIDYLNGKTVGGIWGEQIYSINYKPFYLNSEVAVRKGNTPSAWPYVDQWPEIWEPDGFNTMRCRVTGRPPRIQNWIQHKTTKEWIQTVDYQAPQRANQLSDDGYIGLQIHGGTDLWQGDENLYKNMKVMELDDNGDPLYPPAAPIITTQPQSLEVQSGAEAVFSVGAENGDLLLYQWQKDGADIENADSAAYVISSVTASDVGAYTVILKNQVGDNTSTSQPAMLSIPTVVQSAKGLSSKNINIHWTNNSPGLQLEGTAEEVFNIKIKNIAGKTLYGHRIDIGAFNLTVPAMGEGVFFIEIHTASKRSAYKIFRLLPM